MASRSGDDGHLPGEASTPDTLNHPSTPMPSAPPPSDRRTVGPSHRTVAPALSPTKKLLFGAVTVLLALAGIELVLWLAQVEPAWVQEDPYAGFSRHIPHFTVSEGTDGERVVTVSPTKERVLNPQTFTAQKAPGVYRIVCVGGSTTYGRPFYDVTSFAGWLRAFLPEADPSRSWEVINAGAISYASYRVLGVMEELARFEPDLFVVYTGHNEFLERRTYTDLTGSRNWTTETLAVRRSPVKPREPVLGEETRAIPVNAVGPDAYQRDDELSAEVVAHFRSSLQRMRDIARQANAGIVFIVPGSNLADFAPFKSEHRSGISESELGAWTRLYLEAGSLSAAGDHDAALRAIDRALELDDRHAALWHSRGQSLRALGRFEPAHEAYTRARDEDVCPLRALGPLVRAVREVGAVEGVQVVDFAALVERQSDHGLPGQTLFHDHVHPTIEANRLMALAIIEQLEAQGIVRLAPAGGTGRPGRPDDMGQRKAEVIARVTAEVEARIDRPLHAQQLRLLAAMLGWLGQPDPARHQAELSLALSGRTVEALLDLAGGFRANGAPDLAAEYYHQAIDQHPDSARAHFALGLFQSESGCQPEAIAAWRHAVSLDPDFMEAHERLGIALASQEAWTQAERHFREALRLAPTSESAHNNLGLILARQGRFDDALVYYRRALELDPRSRSTHYNLGLAYEELGRLEDARAAYRAELRIVPGHPQAQARLRAIQ